MDLALNNLQRLIGHKIQQNNQTNLLNFHVTNDLYVYVYVYIYNIYIYIYIYVYLKIYGGTKSNNSPKENYFIYVKILKYKG